MSDKPVLEALGIYAQKASIAPTRDGVYAILARVADPSWTKVGQLTPLNPSVVGE